MNALRRLAVKMQDLTPVMREVSGVMADAVEENFAVGGRPRWAPLKASTIAGRVREKTWPGKILQRSAAGLASSIEAHHTSSSAIVGTNKTYASIHQFGGRTFPHLIRPSVKKALFWPGAGHPVKAVKHPGSVIPARPFLALEDDDRLEIINVMKRHLKAAMG